MAKKTRIDRRGKIRSIVRKFPKETRQHWSIVKRAQVWERRRIIDDLWFTEIITLSDDILKSQALNFTDTVTQSDTANINGEKVIINSVTAADDGTIGKDFQSPTNASSFSLSDSIGFELASSNSVFNAAKINDFFFNGEGDDFEFFTDSVTISDGVVVHSNKGINETASTSDSIGLNIQLIKSDSVTITDSPAISLDPSFASAATISDDLSFNAQVAKTDGASVSDNIGMSLIVPSVFNTSIINLSQIN
jgi:acetyltransferase-like isoleucine patch superfamily enzyme